MEVFPSRGPSAQVKLSICYVALTGSLRVCLRKFCNHLLKVLREGRWAKTFETREADAKRWIMTTFLVVRLRSTFSST